MRDRLGWGLAWMLGLAGVNACGDDSASKPDTGAQAGDGAGSGGTASAGSGGAGSSGSGGGGAIVPARGCPLTAPKRAELGSKLEPISAAVGVRAVHMTAKGLFWTTDNRIYQLESGGTALQVAECDSGVNVVPNLLTSNATQLAWHGSSNGMLGVWAVPLDGGLPNMLTMVTATDLFVEALALDETHAYFGGSVSNGLRQAPLAEGPMSTQLARPFGLSALTVDGGFAYYVEDLGESVMRVAVDGGMPETVSPELGMIQTIVIDPSAIYVTTLHSIYRVERGQPSGAKVLLALARPTSADNSVTRLLDDGERLVFTDQLENIGWVTKDGESCGYIVSEAKKEVAVPRSDIALDAQYLYVTDWPTRSLSRIKRSDIGLAR